jgi:bacteriocin biosynthesis cyclodehydratase domain-containing protein
VIVAHYVVDPELHGRWLRRDIPHLPIVFGDQTVRIGPLVRPGNGPCLYCLELTRTATDDTWPAVASQLWGRRSPAETALVATEVAAITARLVLSVGPPPLRPSPLGASSIELNTATGRTTGKRHTPHPDCGCLSVPGVAPDAAVGPTGSGIATGAAPGRDPIRLPPRTGEAAAAPG